MCGFHYRLISSFLKKGLGTNYAFVTHSEPNDTHVKPCIAVGLVYQHTEQVVMTLRDVWFHYRLISSFPKKGLGTNYAFVTHSEPNDTHVKPCIAVGLVYQHTEQVVMTLRDVWFSL